MKSHSQTWSKDKMTDVSLGEEPEEIEDDEVIDPLILVLSMKDKEPLSCRVTSVVEGKEPMTSKAEVLQLTTPMPLRRGTSPKVIPLDDGRELESGKVSQG